MRPGRRSAVREREILVVMALGATQNTPLIAGFIVGFSFWQENLLIAVASMLVGSLLSALSMIPTESRIFEGHQESEPAVLANIVTFTSLMLLAAFYIHADWSNWRTDLVGGFIISAILGTAQDLIAKEPVSVTRILALGISSVVSLLIIRLALESWSPLVSVILVTTWFTLVMGVYKLWRKRQQDS